MPVRLVDLKRNVDQFCADDRQGQLTGVDKQGRYEHTFAAKFREYIQPGAVILDVGAACGLYGVFAWSLCPSCRITCFEPDHLSNWVLKTNNQRYCQGAMTIETGYVSNQTQRGTVALDDYCRSRGIVPALIKMDIEGYEYYAVQGMRNLLEQSRPVILMEFHQRKMRDLLNVEPQEILDILRSHHYELWFNGHHWYTTQHQGDVDETWHEAPPNDVNYALWAVYSG
jgi:hypothetical protein